MTINSVRTYLLFTFLLTLMTFKAAAVSNISGDWQGELVVPGQKIPLVIHLNQAKMKATGSLDSPRQKAFNITMSEVSINGDELEFEVAELYIHYKGKRNTSTDIIEGQFTQRGANVSLSFKRVNKTIKKRTLSIDSDGIIGVWSGEIDLPGSALPFVLHIKENENGLFAYADSPAQNAFGLAIDSIKVEQNKLKFMMSYIGASYTGVIDFGKMEVDGNYNQKGASFKLKLTKGKKTVEVSKRPQTPMQPLSYYSENITLDNIGANIKLAGSFTKPAIGSVKATAILITGSGPQDRDETVFRHKPFLVISDYLTKQGYAVLRLDDRGVGKSTGVYNTATSADFATDISSAVDFLRGRKDVGNLPIGLIGHSEGAMIAPMVATKRGDISFLILLAGPGLPAIELFSEREYFYGKKLGLTKNELQRLKKISRNIYREVASLPSMQKIGETIKHDIRASLSSYVSSSELDEKTAQTIALYDSPWFRYFISYNPYEALTKIKIPVLALNGSNDIQVPAASNLRGIQQALSTANNQDFKVLNLPKLNHLFQTSNTGFIEEYEMIEETFSPKVLNEISNWLDKRFR
jgi:uncharacterized protein